MAIKIENRATVQVKELDAQVQAVLDCVPVEHLRGFGRIDVVDRIVEPRLDPKLVENLPVLYRPKVPGMASASGEIALAILFPPDQSFFKRLASRAQQKAILTQSVLSIVAQHYLLTLKSGKKKGPGVERAVRDYVQKYFNVWRDRQTGIRAKLFRPLIPYLERWQKSARKYAADQARKKAAG